MNVININDMYNNLKISIEDWNLPFNSFSKKRLKILDQLMVYLKELVAKKLELNVIFVCTHNSRRSQFAQFWLDTFLHNFGIENYNIFSAGTVETEVHKNVISVIEHYGFTVTKDSEINNKKYKIALGKGYEINLFSKEITSVLEAGLGSFVLIFVCDSAYENCPFVIENQKHFSLTFEDPGRYDEDLNALEYYQKCAYKIAAEMHYLASGLADESY